MGGVVKALVSPIGALLLGKKKKAAPQPVLQAPPSVPRENSAVSDALLSRRGARANQRTGSRGAEAASGGKTRLGT